jgi:hypothetical protein
MKKGNLVIYKFKFGEILRVYKDSCYISWLNGGQSKINKKELIILPSLVSKIGKFYMINI